MKNHQLLFIAAAFLFAQGALAHDDVTLDAMHSPHGGQLRMAGVYHFELVAKANGIAVYVTDHAGSKVPTAGATGSATVLAGKAKTAVPLQPAGDNLLKGSGKFDLAPDMKVAVSIALAGKSPEVARFTPMQKAAPMMMNH
jgi:hypothetical protein